MNVLYIVTAYPRWEGDVITPWLGETIRRLRERSVGVEVLAPAYRGLESGRMDGVPVHRFRYAPRAWETLTHDQTAPDRIRQRPHFLALVPGYVAAGSLAAARLARSGRFDVIHAFWPVPHGLLGAAAKRVSGVPLVSTFFGVELTWVESQLRVLRPVIRSIARASDAVTVISSHTEHAVHRIAPGVPVHRVPFGATVEMRADSTARIRHPRDPFRLLFVGRLVERKGVHVLLEALRLLRDRSPAPAVRLDVVGSGSERAALESRARELDLDGLVEFAGAVPQPELERRFAACDAFVLPAVRDSKGDVEGLGVVLLEALAYGKPLIASASGGIVDIVRDGETGLLVPEGDASALADAIVRLARDPALSARLAEGGRQHAAREFSWDGIIDNLVGLYQQVAHRTKTGQSQ